MVWNYPGGALITRHHSMLGPTRLTHHHRPPFASGCFDHLGHSRWRGGGYFDQTIIFEAPKRSWATNIIDAIGGFTQGYLAVTGMLNGGMYSGMYNQMLYGGMMPYSAMYQSPYGGYPYQSPDQLTNMAANQEFSNLRDFGRAKGYSVVVKEADGTYTAFNPTTGDHITGTYDTVRDRILGGAPAGTPTSTPGADSAAPPAADSAAAPATGVAQNNNDNDSEDTDVDDEVDDTAVRPQGAGNSGGAGGGSGAGSVQGEYTPLTARTQLQTGSSIIIRDEGLGNRADVRVILTNLGYNQDDYSNTLPRTIYLKRSNDSSVTGQLFNNPLINGTQVSGQFYKVNNQFYRLEKSGNQIYLIQHENDIALGASSANWGGGQY